MQNRLSLLTMHKNCYSSHWFKQKKMNIFIFPIVKMAAKYAKINKVRSLGADFKQVSLV